MRKFFKCVFVVFILPVAIFINPLTIRFFRKFKRSFYSVICGLYLSKKLFDVKCNDFPRIYNKKYIKIEGNLNFGLRFRMECIDDYLGYKYYPSIFIGNKVIFGDDCHIGCINKISINRNTLIGSKVLMIDHSHGDGEITSDLIPCEKRLYSKGPIIIGENCWIGECVTILPNVNIGDNCIIGANSVVTKDIPSNCVAVGNPARIVKKIKNTIETTSL